MEGVNLNDWIGRQEIKVDDITPTQAQGMAAIADWADINQVTGQVLPAPWHWLYFLPTPKTSELDVDGHAKRGGFIPAVSLPRRMWAGSRIKFSSPLCIGDRTRRVSTIKNVKSKNGRTGQLAIVTILHEIFVINENEADGDSGRLAISEEQDIVYREASVLGVNPPEALPAPAEPQWSQKIDVDAALLFRFSALTFNAHRIHYDRSYAIEQEGYNGLVVHGPLTATFLLDLLRTNLPKETLQSFSFRGVRPITDAGPLRVEGRRDGNKVLLWALDSTGALAMDARATLA